MTEWHPDSDQLVALALSEATAAEQELLVGHLAACPACRSDYDELSAGVQQALAATPAIAPPAGFSGRVLAAMMPTPLATAGRRSPVRLLVAAAVVVGLLAGVGGTLAVTGWLERTSAGNPGFQPGTATLLTAAGEEIGFAGIARREDRSYLLLTVTAGRPGASYECVLVAADGTRTSGGTWTLSAGYGTDVASGAWLVPIDGRPPTGIELVSATGTVWARGSF